MDSRKVLILFTSIVLICLAAALFGSANVARVAFPAIGFFIAVMWPIIFSLASSIFFTPALASSLDENFSIISIAASFAPPCKGPLRVPIPAVIQECKSERVEAQVLEAKVEVKTKEFSVDVADVEAKVKQKIVSVEKQLQAISIIGARAMVKSQVNLNQYSNKNAEMFDNRQIYLNKTYNDVVLLDEYMVDIYADDNRIAQITMNDPVLKYQNDLRKDTFKRQQAERELRRLRGF